MGYRDYSVAKGHIVDATGHGDFTTIAAAITAASSGQTIFIRPGTYTENPTLKAGVNLAAFDADALTPNVIINGKCTLTTAGTVSICGIQLQTNSDFCLAVTGSAASIVNLENCYVNCTNNTGISFTSSSASSQILLLKCRGNIGTTGIGLFTSTSPGLLAFNFCAFGNSGASTTASTTSSGIVDFHYAIFSSPISCSSSGIFTISYSSFNTSGINSTTLTTAGSGTTMIEYSDFDAGTASAISIGTGSEVQVFGNCGISSSNTNAITGAGTIQYSLISYTGSSSVNNVTTQTAFANQGSPWTLLKTLTASSSANITFTSTNIMPTYKAYALVLQNVVPATNNVSFGCQVSANNGSTYLATGYDTVAATQGTGGSSATTSTTTWLITQVDVANTAAKGISGTLYIYNLTNGVTPSFSGQLIYESASAGHADMGLSGGFAPATTTVNNIQFTFSSGNISTGTFSLYGILN